MVRFLFFGDFNNFDDVNPWKLTGTSGVDDGVVPCPGEILLSTVSSLTGLLSLPHLEGNSGILGLTKDLTAFSLGSEICTAVSFSFSSSESENPGPIHKDHWVCGTTGDSSSGIVENFYASHHGHSVCDGLAQHGKMLLERKRCEEQDRITNHQKIVEHFNTLPHRIAMPVSRSV